MRTKASSQILIVLSLSLSVLGLSLANCGLPAQSQLVNKTFIPIPGCIAGESYQTTTLTGNCTCWRQAKQRCGYICDNEAIPTPDSDTQLLLHKGQISIRKNKVLSRLRRQTTCPLSSLPPNTRWVPSSGCAVGNSYQTSTEMCNCCGSSGYICGSINPPATNTTTTTAAPTTTNTVAPSCPPSPFPSNAQSYIPDDGCTLLEATTTQAIIISNGTLACICTSPVQCGMLCYSLSDGSNLSG